MPFRQKTGQNGTNLLKILDFVLIIVIINAPYSLNSFYKRQAFVLILIKLIALIIVFAIVAKVFLPKPLFVINIKSGKAFASHGKVPKAFLNECELICSESHITKGKIKGIRFSNRISLRFSYHIPKTAHQKFRNAYSFSS